METLEIPVFNNIVKDISPRKISETMLQDGMNILFEDGYLRDRYGIFSLDFEFSDPIKRAGLFRRTEKRTGYTGRVETYGNRKAGEKG